MTVPKSLERKEVERVAATLRNTLKIEWPEIDDAFLDFPPAAPKATTKRRAAVLDAFRLAWAASARFTRKTQRELAKKRGSGEAFFDDRQTDAAIICLERARTLVRNAGAAIEMDIARIRKERARIGLRGEDVGDLPEHVGATENVVVDLERLLERLKTFQGIPQARTRGEWDAFVSSAAQKLLSAGFGTREVAGMLTGKHPEDVDRATLERFRQRMNRLAVSKG